MSELGQDLLLQREHYRASLSRDQFLDRILLDTEDPAKKQATESALDDCLALWPNSEDYFSVANQIGHTLSADGVKIYDIAANAYEFAFQYENPWAEETPIYAGNFVGALKNYYEAATKGSHSVDRDWFFSKRKNLAL